MKKVDDIFDGLCDLIESLKLSERFQDKGFQKSWAAKKKRVDEGIANLNEDEYTDLERRYKEWFSKLGKSNEDPDSI